MHVVYMHLTDHMNPYKSHCSRVRKNRLSSCTGQVKILQLLVRGKSAITSLLMINILSMYLWTSVIMFGQAYLRATCAPDKQKFFVRQPKKKQKKKTTINFHV